LLLVGLGLLIGGFLTEDSNVLLIISIVVELAVIILVLGAWARRAREASSYGFEEAPAIDAEPEEEDLYATIVDDEEFAVGGRRTTRERRPARRPASRKTGAKPARKPKAKPAAERTAKLKPAKAKPKAKASKPKATRKAKPKAAGTARPKAKPARRRPPTP
jgi:FtsZ-interacting cell division protein ZipA